ncbi:alpha/beta fold hydrolase [Aeromicrobium yanjiei]|uniref:Alpha/beta fold hydrolase n=1 Tax=Aeromicrobium yanjiei TaxID=2662028 RepID=A0A5Q2MEM1_9ACTN|nr:alpha/beta hydrolase [Aeromicrobium yanjiei]QGG41554.1 alpha/beta fold hydrolase [Aeromicrobium yanjiei]
MTVGEAPSNGRSPRTVSLSGADGLKLAADIWGPDTGPSVLMLHGGGQTRHSWKATSRVLADAGLRVVALDLRGHGDSDWSPDGGYGFEKNSEDVLEVLDQIDTPTTIIGASLGGLTGLLATAAAPDRVRRLAMVDVVPRFEAAGSARIRDFMRGAPRGFASLDEAADAIAAYLPHREKPRSTDGLRRNLRLRDDGRWYWHWDPQMMEKPPTTTPGERSAQLEAAARTITVPVLLLQGKLSDVISDHGVEEFRGHVPHLEVVTLNGAAHTAAGDDNDAFSAAVVEFCSRP